MPVYDIFGNETLSKAEQKSQEKAKKELEQKTAKFREELKSSLQKVVKLLKGTKDPQDEEIAADELEEDKTNDSDEE